MRASLSARVFMGFVAILLLFSGTVAFGLMRMHRVRDSLRHTAETYVGLTRNVAQVKTLLDIRDDYTARALSEADPRLRAYLVRYARDFYPRAIRTRLTEALSSARGSLEKDLPEEERRFLQATLEALLAMERAEAGVEETLNELFDRPDVPEAQRAEVRERAKERADALVKQSRLLSLNLDERVAQSVLKAERDEHDASWALITLSAVAGVIGLLLTWWIARSLRPLRELSDAARALARGSYDVPRPVPATAEVMEVALALEGLAAAIREREGALARGHEELSRLKAFLESVLASARVSIVVTDEQLRVRRLNPAARSAFRLGLSEAEGKPLQELALWEPLRSHEQAIRRAATGGEGLHLSAVSVTRSDGTELILDVDVEPLRDPVRATPVTGLVVMGTDVTERERARQRLGATEHLAAVGHLAAQVAHEVRNPLSSLGLNCELLEDEVSVLEGTRGTEAKRLLKAMGREIDRLAALTEGYLRHARLARGPARAVDLNAAVEELASLVRDDLRRKGVTLTLMCSPRAGRVKADPSGLRQALLNLVRNAVEAVSGHPQAQVRVQTARDGDRVTLAVQDNGPGVPEELRERIFQPFFTTRESGSGLGLSVSRQSLEEHGGTLRCEVAPGGGARFVASLVGVDESSPPLPAPLPEDDEVVVAPEVPPPGHAPDAAPRNKH